MEIKEEIRTACCLDLIEYIKWKNDDIDIAKASFDEFCIRFQDTAYKKAVIYCSKWGLNDVVALDIVQCAFERVWKYPTYNHSKSKSRDIEKGIKIWLCQIIFTQLANYHKKGTCFSPDDESDLSIVYTVDELIDRYGVEGLKKHELKRQLSFIDSALSVLSEKHKIIYLTYRLYAPNKKDYIPKQVNDKLQEHLQLTTGSIRKYKQAAKGLIDEYVKKAK